MTIQTSLPAADVVGLTGSVQCDSERDLTAVCGPERTRWRQPVAHLDDDRVSDPPIGVHIHDREGDTLALPAPVGQPAPIRRKGGTQLVDRVGVGANDPTRLLVEGDQPDIEIRGLGLVLRHGQRNPPVVGHAGRAGSLSALSRTVVGVGTVVGTVVVLGALVVGALVVVGSVVATAPPLAHAVITSRATTSPAGLNLIVIRRPPERIAFIAGLHPLGLSPSQGRGRGTPFSVLWSPSCW